MCVCVREKQTEGWVFYISVIFFFFKLKENIVGNTETSSNYHDRSSSRHQKMSASLPLHCLISRLLQL